MTQLIVGWREWIKLPEMGIPGLKAKVDSGAKTSCLHAFEVTTRKEDGQEMVDFKIHPLRKKRSLVIACSAPLVDKRIVRDSGGHSEERLVVESTLILGGMEVATEFTLTRRDDMMFPMLLGRRAIESIGCLVDVRQSYVHGRVKTRQYEKLLEEFA